jgi:hypothetical protein
MYALPGDPPGAWITISSIVVSRADGLAWEDE